MTGFKAFFESAFVPADLTVLIGANGAGKTSTLQALELIGSVAVQSFADKLSARHWEYNDLFNRMTKGQTFSFTAEFDDEKLGKIIWTIRLGKRKGIYIAGESVRRRDGQEVLRRDGRNIARIDNSDNEEQVVLSLGSSMLSTLDPSDADKYPEQWAIASWARSMQRYVALDPADLRKASRKSDTIGLRGESLGGNLLHLRERADGSFERVLKQVRAYYPHLRNVILRQQRAGWISVTTSEEWGGRTQEFTATQVSDGLLRMLAVACVGELSSPPSLVMFDEIENGVHPSLLSGLMGSLRDLAYRGGTQVVVTTHSPIAVNAIQDDPREDVILVFRDPDGGAKLHRIADHPKFQEYRRHMGVGELWYTLGDDVLSRS